MRSLLLKAASRKPRRPHASSHGACKEGPDLFIKGQEGSKEFKSLKKQPGLESSVVRHHKFSSPEGVILQMFYMAFAGVSPCFSSAAICLFLHLLILLFLNRGRANRYLCVWERLKGLTPPPLHVHCPNAKATWLGVHIMDHATEQAGHYCRLSAVLAHSSSQICLAAKGLR